jgi:hypothetical protein
MFDAFFDDAAHWDRDRRHSLPAPLTRSAAWVIS